MKPICARPSKTYICDFCGKRKKRGWEGNVHFPLDLLPDKDKRWLCHDCFKGLLKKADVEGLIHAE